MKRNIKKSVVTTLGAVALFALVGCSDGGSPTVVDDSASGSTPTDSVPLNGEETVDAPFSQELKDLITFMYNEESLAHDVYLAIYDFQAQNALKNIAQNSETKHIAAVNDLAIKYDLNVTQYPDTEVPYSIEGIAPGVYPVEKIQDLYTMLYDKGIQSPVDALEVGCMVEVVDIEDLDDAIAVATRDGATDVLDVFNFLEKGSYTHYWAFSDALVNQGITDGCCSLGTEYCHPEYPKK